MPDFAKKLIQTKFEISLRGPLQNGELLEYYSEFHNLSNYIKLSLASFDIRKVFISLSISITGPLFEGGLRRVRAC